MTLPAPDAIRERYASWTWSVAWEWPEVSATWRLEDADTRAVHFVKVGRSDHHPTVLDETARTRWARRYLPVPDVVDAGSDGTVDWLVTIGLDGTDATTHPLRADPARLVPALAAGLAAFHRAAPVESCPLYDFTVPTAIEHVRGRVRAGTTKPTDLHPEHEHLTVERAVSVLEQLAPAREDLVVCHGDYCLPNVLLDDDGVVTGYVDLGELAVADRWWDVAVGAWSVTWNLGPGWEELFYDAYGARPDEDRIVFYRLLYDLAS